MADCDFCRIIRGEESADLVFEDDSTLAFAPLAPAVRGHTLVVPKEHVSDFIQASEDTLANVIATTQLVAKGIANALDPEGFNVITSAGEAASQTVFHLHVHIVPRWAHDRMGEIWPPGSTYLEETKDDVAGVIRRAVDDLANAAGRDGRDKNADHED